MNFCLSPSSCLHKENYVTSTNHVPHPCTLPMWKVLKGPDYVVSMYKMVTSNLPAVCGSVLWQTVIKPRQTAQPCMQLSLAHLLQV